MPAVRTTPKDVLIRVPKVEPYSNSYVPPSVRAKEEAKKAAATAEGSTGAGTSAVEAATDPASSTVDPTSSVSSSANAEATEAPLDATAPSAPTTSAPTADAPEASASTDQAGADATKADDKSKEGRERGNSPILPFLSPEREEEQTVELSKAATSSAGWNSLLVWARRQRGAQWDASTALWQVDKYSREYYSFCEDPATTDRLKQPGDEHDATESKTASAAAAGAADAQASSAAGEEDEDKGPTRVSSRNKTEDATRASSPPPVAHGRSARLSRR